MYRNKRSFLPKWFSFTINLVKKMYELEKYISFERNNYKIIRIIIIIRRVEIFGRIFIKEFSYFRSSTYTSPTLFNRRVIFIM